MQEVEVGGLWSKADPGKNTSERWEALLKGYRACLEALSSIPNHKKKRTGGMAPVVECLLSSEFKLQYCPLLKKTEKRSQAPVVHACNPSYIGGRDQEDLGWKPARRIVLKTLSQKKKVVRANALVLFPVFKGKHFNIS
jgi:hypothetical protein